MSDVTKEDLASLVTALQAQAAQQATEIANITQPSGRFSKAMGGAVQGATGFSIPCKLHVGRGSVRVDIHFPAEQATPDGMFEAMNAIDQAGLEVDVWEPRSGYGGTGGYRNGGGGYGGGGFRGGNRYAR